MESLTGKMSLTRICEVHHVNHKQVHAKIVFFYRQTPAFSAALRKRLHQSGSCPSTNEISLGGAGSGMPAKIGGGALRQYQDGWLSVLFINCRAGWQALRGNMGRQQDPAAQNSW